MDKYQLKFHCSEAMRPTGGRCVHEMEVEKLHIILTRSGKMENAYNVLHVIPGRKAPLAEHRHVRLNGN
jgi:hypothetical protein